MKVMVLFHAASDHARSVEEFAHSLHAQHRISAELVSLESRSGAEAAKLYGVTSYPTVIATNNEGAVLALWQGPSLPLLREVVQYA